jgi:hypothetical protein
MENRPLAFRSGGVTIMGTIIHLPNAVQQRVPLPTAMQGAMPRRYSEGEKIGLLIFRCPVTAHDIESGIEMDSQTFRWTGHLSASLRCRACCCTHELKVADGTLTP